MSKYLIDERPLTVLPSLVAMVGLERAMILQQIHYICQQPKSGTILGDGEKWTWNSYREWQEEYFPFWTEANIQKHILKLEKEGYLLACQPYLENGNATKSYRVNIQKITDPSFTPVDDAHPLLQYPPIIDSSRPPSFTPVDYLLKDSKSSTNNSTKEEANASREEQPSPYELTYEDCDPDGLPLKKKQKPQRIQKSLNPPRTANGKPRPIYPPASATPVAVQMVEKIMGKRLDKLLWDEVLAKVDEVPDEELLNKCRTYWLGRGWNEYAIGWLDYYKIGIPSYAPKSNGNGTPKLRSAKEILAEREAQHAK